ncbi:MAG: sensor histidine kinase [Burkholderiaceae bacterium]
MPALHPLQLSPPADAAEQAWVQDRLIRRTMSHAGPSLVALACSIPLLFFVLYGHAAGAGLLVWALAAMLICGFRAWHLRRYLRDFAGNEADTAGLQAFWQQIRWGWTLTAVVWGSSILLYHDLGLGKLALVCAVVLVSIAAASVNVLSATLDGFKQFNTALGSTVLGALTLSALLDTEPGSQRQSASLIVMVLVFMALLRNSGHRLHSVQRSSATLQYRNRQLIESLTRQTQAALEAVAIKDRFLASAAHDIRQPVHALGLYADWLSSEPELVGEIAPKIVESTKAVNTLFDSLFDLVRLDSGKVPINVQPVDLQRLMDDLEINYKPLALSKGLQWRRRCRPGMVMSDPILLYRLLGNLLSNAVKYTDSGGVLLACRVKNQRVCVEVWDTGVGIEPQYHAQIFTEFYKVPTHSGTADSFGLGLAIVARQSAILASPVELQSRPGRGSVFRVGLSDVDEAQAHERAAHMVTQLVSKP